MSLADNEQNGTYVEGESPTVRLEIDEGVATIWLARSRYRNAQNSQMTYELDRAFSEAAQDDDVAVIVLGGDGDHFSAGHDLGSPGRDLHVSFPRVSMWWDSVGKEGAEQRWAREEEIYLGMCRRWRDIPKPTIAMVQGACISGGLMLAWACDLIVAADDAFFSDAVVDLGMPGVEYFAHPWEMGPRQAKEALFLGTRIDAARAYELGMVNHVVPRAELRERTSALAREIAKRNRLALAMIKRSVNAAEDAMGKRAGMDTAFMIHQLAHSHWAETTGDSVMARRVLNK